MLGRTEGLASPGSVCPLTTFVRAWTCHRLLGAVNSPSLWLVTASPGRPVQSFALKSPNFILEPNAQISPQERESRPQMPAAGADF